MFAVLLLLSATLSAAAPILLIRGTTSTPNDAERNFAAAVTRRVDGWLTELGVAHEVVDDDALSSCRLKPARVAVLTYNPNPPAAELRLLEQYVKGGGRLIVFYAADVGLARLMEVRLGAYRADPTARRWTRMRFEPAGVAGAPGSVLQRSRNIRPVTPLGRTGRVVAYWEDVDGQRGEPAWVETTSGYWMSHVLLDDGDTWHKQQLLVALLGALDPSVWPIAAAAALCRAETLGQFRSFSETERQIRSRAPRTGSAAGVAATLGAARRIRLQVKTLIDQAEYVAAIEQANILYGQLIEAYASTFQVWQQPLRCVWDHSGLGLYPGDWSRSGHVLDQHEVTDLFVNASWPGKALYPSTLLPVDDRVALYGGDPLRDALAAGHAHGMKVHLWKVCWNLDGAPAALMTRLDRGGRLQRSDGGETLPWLCPSHPDNLRYEKDALREALTRYAVDGIHLDYIRYPGSHACYCDGCRRRFEAHLGRRVAVWPADARRGHEQPVFNRWRCAQITRLVRDVSSFARQMRPGIQISAAVYGKYPSCVGSVAQEWPAWVNDGLIDFVVPMDYSTSLEAFTSLVTEQVALVNEPRRLCPGIGVTAAESRLGVPAVLQQLEVVKQSGAGGFVFFDLNEVLAQEILPYLTRPGP
ncbi:MAG: family 10 glycosylhydrolase [Lentisphaerae bacterium]|nr:family 10 glycosylhydrolase [Lentisphaerota bacterium]